MLVKRKIIYSPNLVNLLIENKFIFITISLQLLHIHFWFFIFTCLFSNLVIGYLNWSKLNNLLLHLLIGYILFLRNTVTTFNQNDSFAVYQCWHSWFHWAFLSMEKNCVLKNLLIFIENVLFLLISCDQFVSKFPN